MPESNQIAPAIVYDRATFAEYKLDLPAIARQIRLCRSTLGAVLEELETGVISADSQEKIGDFSTSVSAEIERLWECFKQSE